MRVLHVLGGLGIGGAETMVMNLYRNIDRTKIQFDFVIYEDGQEDYLDEILQLGGKVYRSPHYNLKNTINYLRFWSTFFDAHPEYGIVHGHVRSTASIYLSIAASRGVITIAHSHSISNGKGIKSIIKFLLQLPLRNCADYYFACSEDAGRWLFGKKVIKKNTFFVLKNAIQTEKFEYDQRIRKQVRERLHIEDKFVLCNVGRFSFPKNHEFIISVFKIVLEKKPNSILLLVGEGELKKQIENMADSLNIRDKIIFYGTSEHVEELLCAADVFLFPSRYEGLGMAAIEAQAASLMTLCSDKIPEEVFITSYSKKISIEKPMCWVDEILKYSEGYSRKSVLSEIKNAGYDLKSTVPQLQNFYLSLQ